METLWEDHSEYNMDYVLSGISETEYPYIINAIRNLERDLSQIAIDNIPASINEQKTIYAIEYTSKMIQLLAFIWRRINTLKLEHGDCIDSKIVRYNEDVILPLYRHKLPGILMYLRKVQPEFQD